ERCLASGVPGGDPRRFGISDRLLGLSDEDPQSGLPLFRRPKRSYLQQLKILVGLLTWPADQPRHATGTSTIRSNPVRPRELPAPRVARESGSTIIARREGRGYGP